MGPDAQGQPDEPVHPGRCGVKSIPPHRVALDHSFLAGLHARERPPGKTLDRIDNARGYEPGNCRWSTHQEQVENSRVAKLTRTAAEMIRTLRSSGSSVRDIAQQFGVKSACIYHVLTGRTWR